MKVTKKQAEEGAAIAEKLRVNGLFINKKGEYFTSENLAALSVGGKKDQYARLDFSAQVPDTAGDEPKEE